MKKTILLALRCCALLCFIFSFTSYAQKYKASASNQNSGNNKKIQKLADIYVAGFCYNPTTQRGTAVYWKNGEPVALTDGQSNARALSIVVVGDDIYVLGIVGGQSVYWKNGQKTVLSVNEKDFVNPKSIAVINGDVYVVGDCGPRFATADTRISAIYWKDGQIVKLPVSMDESSSANYIAAIDDDIYILGSTEMKDLYWKNGQKVETINELKKVSAIAQLQGNAYAVGTTVSGQAAYWKNGHIEILPSNGLATCIAVSGNDVYVAGIHDVDGYGRIDTDDKGKYWKNGQLLGDLNGTDYFIYRPESIAVSGNDVYVVGRAQIVSNGGYRMGFLKNGQSMDLKVIEGCSASIANFVTSNGGSEGKIIKQNNKANDSKISKQGKVDPVNDNVEAPQILEPKNYAVLEQYPRATKIAWTPVSQATEYDVIIEYGSGPGTNDLDFNENINFYPYISGKTKANAVSFNGAGAQVHRYKIVARNKDKIISTTDWYFMRYVH